MRYGEKALKPFGDEYAALLDRAFNERWIDVVENKGKRSGAYSMGTFGCHPYVLLNYQKSTHEVFTIAHELGHAMHTYFSCKAQPFAKSDYEIFVAEIASTVNEVLMLKYLLANTDNVDTKKFLLSYYLDMFRTTCSVRQCLPSSNSKRITLSNRINRFRRKVYRIFIWTSTKILRQSRQTQRPYPLRMGAYPALLYGVLRLSVRNGYHRRRFDCKFDIKTRRQSVLQLQEIPVGRRKYASRRNFETRRRRPYDRATFQRRYA